MFGPPGLTVAAKKKERDDSKVLGHARDSKRRLEEVSVSQLLFYMGSKAVTDIVFIYRRYFLQKSTRNLGF